MKKMTARNPQQAVSIKSFWFSLYELLSSMRFAIGLLTILSIASIIGTVLQQNQAYPSYIAEFGQYWFTIFEWLGLFDVYHSLWFLLLLGFLVLSTSLCIWRNTPQFLRDMKSWREHISEQSLIAMHRSVSLPPISSEQATQILQKNGFRLKQFQRENGDIVIAGRRGASNRLGYFFAHIALVVICLGGLIDGNLPLKIKEMMGYTIPELRDIPESEVPTISRLDSSNLSYRGTVTIPEKKAADVVFLNAGRGYLVQELPILIQLEKFSIEHYANGMPKLFASDLLVTKKSTGEQIRTRIEVNRPLHIDGLALYQSSFGDGGSPLTFKAWNFANHQASTIHARSMSNQSLVVNDKTYQFELSELRTFNIEEMDDPNAHKPTGLAATLQQAQTVQHEKNLKNLGPSIQFKLRDSRGQAVEYLNYMAPIELEEQFYFVTAQRKAPNEPFNYLRMPLDETMKIDSFMRLFAALHDASLLERAAERAAAAAQLDQAIRPEMKAQFQASVLWVLQRFAEGGFIALEQFLDERVPQDKRQAVAQTYVKILQGVIADVDTLAREKAGLAPLNMTPNYYRFLLDALVAISGLTTEYASPVYLELETFEQVQASGIQVTRSPGKNIVYLGSLLLTLGIIFMFYIRDVRIWVRLSPTDTRLALSSNRHSPELDRDFEKYKNLFL